MLGSHSAFKTYQGSNDVVQTYKLFWTSDINHNIEGTSDNEEQPSSPRSEVQIM